MSLPEPSRPEQFAFFFDFDGTLADIVARPEDVEVTLATREALAALRLSLEGAVAIITGRDIASIDRFLTPEQLPVAGVHGLTRRDASGHTHRPEFDSEALKAIEAKLQPLVAGRNRSAVGGQARRAGAALPPAPGIGGRLP